MTPESMHLINQGVTRALFRRTFHASNTSVPPGRLIAGKRVDPAKLTNGLNKIKSPSEFDRKPRSLEEKNFSDYKASGKLCRYFGFRSLKSYQLGFKVQSVILTCPNRDLLAIAAHHVLTCTLIRYNTFANCK